MKKIFLLGLCVLASTSLFAQEKFGKVDNTVNATYGIKAGVTFPSISGIKNNGVSTSYSADDQSITSFYAGFVANIPLDKAASGNVYLQPGLSYVGKGGESVNTSSTLGGDITVKRTISYLVLPVNILFGIKAGTGRVVIGAGPYLGIAFSGKSKTSTSGALALLPNSPSNSTSSLKIGSQGAIRTWDFGMGLQLGYQLANGLSINIGSDIGLTNIDGYADSGVNTRNQLFSAGLGFTFR